MLTPPESIIALLNAFAPLFTRPAFRLLHTLILGTILTTGRRTVASALRAVGLSQEKHFQNYHRLLNRAKWSSRKAAKVLLLLLVEAFVPDGPLLLGIDETLERRQGEKIKAKGIYRDATRSSKSCFVKASGLRWVSLMLLTPIPWARRTWALPFLTVLAPSERYDKEQGKCHKTLARWAGQMLIQVRRWIPQRPLVLVADGGYAVLTLLHRLSSLDKPVVAITRLRLDAALYAETPPRANKQNGRPRKKGKRLPTLASLVEDTATVWTRLVVPRYYSQSRREIEIVSACCIWYHSGMPPVPIRYVLIRDPEGKFAPQALLCTDGNACPEQIVSWFVLRWQLETTFQEVRLHLGVETQRQWSDLAILRTTPALLGLFSLVTLLAQEQWIQGKLSIRQSAWYAKEVATFSDALASVRRDLWRQLSFWMSSQESDIQKHRDALLDRFSEVLCYPA
jgi:hypothetical protein